MKTEPKLKLHSKELPRTKRRASPKDVSRRLDAEDHLRHQRRATPLPPIAADASRLVRELQVHQVELETQNAELQDARDRMELLLAKYTDLYDFAPVGYLSLNEQGRILEANQTGAVLLGLERSRLIGQSLSRLVAPSSRPVVVVFLDKLRGGSGTTACELQLSREGGAALWVNLHGDSVASADRACTRCRVAISDITALKQAEAAQRQVEALTIRTVELQKEIVHRQAVEEALRQSEHHQNRLLEHSRDMQQQLKRLSHQLLQAQEAERKRISRELHDEIAQSLVGINVHLATLGREAEGESGPFRRKIARTRRMVEKAVDRVHQFALELRPMALDDLGLIAALKSFMKDFMKRTGIRIRLTTFPGVEQLDGERRTVLYRVIQSALANVAQHAGASRVEVSIRKLEDIVQMEVADNGRGFDVERALHSKRPQRLGLLGMRERLEMVGGSLSLESAAGQGTIIRALIPRGRRRGRVALLDASTSTLGTQPQPNRSS